MANLQIDLDSVARDMGETLDMVQYAIMAAKSPDIEFERKPNFSKALVSGIAVESVAAFILGNLPPADVANRERFSALRSDAQKLVKRFWANFTLVNVHRDQGGGYDASCTQNTPNRAGCPKGHLRQNDKETAGNKRSERRGCPLRSRTLPQQNDYQGY